MYVDIKEQAVLMFIDLMTVTYSTVLFKLVSSVLAYNFCVSK